MASQVPIPPGLNLDDPKHFAPFFTSTTPGDTILVTVLERQQGTAYTPQVPQGAPSAYTDEVLLSNGTSVFQCRLCAVPFIKAQSVNAHLACHSPNRIHGPGALKARQAEKANGVKALRRPLKEALQVSTATQSAKKTTQFVPEIVNPDEIPTAARPRKYITKSISEKTGDAVRTARAVREQLSNITGTVTVLEERLLEFDRLLNDKSVDVAELKQELVDLAEQRDELKEQLRTAEQRAAENEEDAHKWRTIKGMMS